MDISGYAVRIRDGEYSLKPGDSYETIARTITQSDKKNACIILNVL